MGWGIVGAVLGGGALNLLGADKAASQQARATDRATAEQRRQFDLSREDLAPWREAGVNALGEYSGYGRSRVNVGDYLPDTQVPTFDPSNLNVYADPSYQFRVAEGENLINRNMAGMGKVMSGNRLGELQQYGQDMASKEYGAMYGRAIDDYKMRALQEDAMYNRGLQRYNIDYGGEADYLNRLAGISGVGQSTAMGGAQIGQGYANNISNLQVQGGQAQAAGTMGRYNALGNMLNQGAMLYGMGAFDSPTYRTDYSIPMTSRSY